MSSGINPRSAPERVCPFCGDYGAVCTETERVCIERQQEEYGNRPPKDHRSRNCWITAFVFLFIAFAPITAAEHGFNPFPEWAVAWCLIGIPLAMGALIAAMVDDVDER